MNYNVNNEKINEKWIMYYDNTLIDWWTAK